MNMTRIVSWVTAAVMSQSVFAATMYTNEVNGVKWVYSVSDGKATLGGGSSYSRAIVGQVPENVEVPSTLDGTEVVAISSYAFSGFNGMTSVVVPTSVQTIGYNAFSGCSGLRSVTVPFVGSQRGNANGQGDNFGYIFGSSSSMGSSSVRQNYYYNNGNNTSSSTYYIPTNLTSVTITDDTVLRPYAFQNCSMLTNVVMNGEVTSIGNYAFEGCSHLASFIVPESASAIGSYAFRNCTALTSVEIPQSVKWIGSYAFGGCSLLGAIDLPTGVCHLYEGAFSGCTAAANVVIPNTVTNIGQYAFQNCSSLSAVEVPNSVKSLGYNAFGGCYRLSSMTLPFVGSRRGNANGQGDNFGYIFGSSSSEGSASVRQNYYYNNGNSSSSSTYYIPTNLSSVVIMDDSKLRPYAFQNCTMLTNVVVNAEVTIVGNYAFSGCTRLRMFAVPSLASSIGSGAFSDCSSLSSVSIPGSVRWIGSYAFQNCSCLCEINLPQGICHVYDYAFSGCSSAASVTIPNTVTNIGQYAFQNCSSLSAVAVPNSVKSLGYNAFGGCYRLSSMTLPFVGSRRGNANGQGDNFGYIFGSSSSEGSTSVRQNYYYNNGNSSSSSTYYIPTSLSSVVITDDTVLRPYAFQNCTMLTNIVVNSTVSNIGSYAFSGCSGLRSFVISDSATSIGNYAFSGCSRLTELVVPSNVRSIGSYAFQDCTSLTSMRIRSDYVAIDQYAFSECPSAIFDTTSIAGLKLLDGYVVGTESTLSGVVDLSSTRGVVANAFYGNTKITKVVLPEGMTSVPAYTFYGCSALADIAIPSTVKSIGAAAFCGCNSLKGVVIPDATTTIGNEAFSGCRKITSVTLPESLRSIGNYSLHGCSALQSIDLPEGLQTIGYYAFANCTSLRNVSIPTTLQSVGSGAFSGDSSLATVNIKDLSAWCKIVFADSSSNPVCYSRSLTLNGEVVRDLFVPEGLSRLKDYVFYNNYALTSITIPDGIAEIPHYAFYRCCGITNSVLPESVTKIGTSAFQGCTNLTAFSFPVAITNISDYAFAECSGLLSLGLPASLQTLGDYCFYKCYGIRDVEIPESVIGIGQYTFNTCTNLATVTIHNGLTSIGSNAFYGSARLTVSLANDVETVPSNLFRYCGGIVDVLFPESVTNIASYAFYGCSQLSRLDLPNALRTIGSYAFYNCTSLPEVVIPEGVTSIGQYAFGNCTKLTQAVVPSTVKTLGQYAFSGCSRLSSVDLAEGATSIGNYAFQNCTTLGNVVVPSTVKTVGERAFDGCTGLKSVSLPDGLATIGNCAFRNCRSLSALDIPSSVGKIGEYAFERCNGLQNLSIPDGVATIGNHAFYGCTNLLTLAVPASATNIGWYAFAACSNLTQVTLLTTPSRVIPTADISMKNWDWRIVDGDMIQTDSLKLYSSMSQEMAGNGVLSFEWKAPGYWYYSSYYNKDCFEVTGHLYADVDYWVSEYSSGSYFGDSCYSEDWSPVAVSVSNADRHTLRWWYERCLGYYYGDAVDIDQNTNYGSIRSLSFIQGRAAGNGVDGTIVGASAFEGCVKLERVDIEDVGDWCGTIFENAWANPLRYAKRLYANGKEITDLVIPPGTTAVAGWTFADCESITNVVMPEGVAYIGSHAFQRLDIRDIVLPSSVTNVGSFAFAGCDGVRSISMSSGMQKINDFAFAGQENVITATLPSGIRPLSAYLPDSLRTVREIAIAGGETEIVDNAFAGCSALESVRIPDTMRKIGKYAFDGCSRITRIEIPASVNSVMRSAFDNCARLAEITVADGSTSYASRDGVLFDERGQAGQLLRCPQAVAIKEYDIPEGTARVYEYAFLGCAEIERIFIPASVTNIGTRAFAGCSSLSRLEVAEDNPAYKSIDGVLFTKDGNTLLRFPHARAGHYEIPEGVATVAAYAFEGCGRLASVTFGADVKTIEGHAFDGCVLLGQTMFNAGLTRIGDYAFANCVSLAAATVPESVANLGEGAFDGCDQLESLYIPENITIKPMKIGGLIRGNQSLYRGCVYRVTNDLSIASGAVLKIPAGITLKFERWGSLIVRNNGKLIASGTRAAPVVFTSLQDDSFGGDTNGNGGSSQPQAGDWSGLSVFGEADLTYTRIRYGATLMNVQNAPSWEWYWYGYEEEYWTDYEYDYYDGKSGILNMEGCILEHGSSNGIENYGGKVSVRNSVFTDLATAITGYIWGYYGDGATGTNHFVNCVVEGCDYATYSYTWYDSGNYYSDGSEVFENCILANIQGWVDDGNGVQTENIPDGIAFSNCCFWNPPEPEFYPIQTNALIGVDGNIWDNPQFEDAPNGNYRIKSASPCVDAGNEINAPVRDFFGQPRNGMPDIGIYEVQVRPVDDADLAALSISGDTTAEIGGSITVAWTVSNVGTVDIVDEWRDAVEIVDANGRAIELGRQTVLGGLVSGGNKTFTATYAVPSMSPGTARLRLKVNPYRDIYEGTLTANNVCLSESTVEIVLPAYDPVANSSFELRAGGSVALRVPAGSGTTAFKLTGSGSAAISAYALAGGVPAGLRYDVAAVPLADGSILLVLPKNAAEMDYNIAVFNDATSSATVSMESVTESVSVLEVAPARLANTGEGHLTIIGTGMDRVSAVRLEGASTIASTKFRADSSASLSATFDLSGATIGSYAVILVDEDGETYRTGKPVEVYNPKIGPKLEAWLELPSSTRQGRVYTGYIAYANIGDEDMNAPYFKLSAVEATLSLDGSMFKSKPLHVMGISSVSPVGVLAPGTEGKIAFFFKSGSRPRFHLDVESDPSSEWNATSAKLAAAATTLNERGRYIVDATTISSFAMNCETNTSHYAISGRFSFANGDDPEGVTVFAEDAKGNMVSVDEVDANGVFILGGLSATSNYVVTAERNAFAQKVEVIMPTDSDASGVVLQGVKPLTLNFVVTGVDDGHLMGAGAYLCSLIGETLETASVWEDGVCAMTTTNVGWFTAEVVLPSGTRLSRSVCLDASDDETDLEFDFSVAASCVGLVTDMAGNALSNAYVSVAYVDGRVIQTLVTDESGSYRILGLDAGHYVLSVAKDGYSSDSVTFVYDGTTSVTAATLRIAQLPGGVAGSCQDSMVEYFVCISKSDDSFYRLVQPNEDGTFMVSLAQGAFDVYCVDEDGVLRSEVERIDVSDTVVSVTMQPAATFAVKCEIRDSAGNALRATVRMRGEKGVSLKAATDESGIAEFSVAAGGYWVTALAEGYPEQNCYVTLERSSTVSIQLRQGGFIVGTLDVESNADFVDIFKDSELVSMAVVKEDGSFASSALPVGTYYVCSQTTNGLLYADNVAVSANVTNVVALSLGTRDILISLDGSEAAKTAVSYLVSSDIARPDADNTIFKDEKGAYRIVNAKVALRKISAYSTFGTILGSTTVDGTDCEVILPVSELMSAEGSVVAMDGNPLAAQLHFYNQESGSSGDVDSSGSGKFVSDAIPSDYRNVCVTSMDGKSWTFLRSEVESAHYNLVCDEVQLKSCRICVFDNAVDRKPVWGIEVMLKDSQGNEIFGITDANGICQYAVVPGTFRIDIYQDYNLIYRNESFAVTGETTRTFYLDEELGLGFAKAAVASMRARTLRLAGALPDNEKIDYLILDDRDKRYNEMWQSAHDTLLHTPPPCKCGYDCACNRQIYDEWVAAYKDYLRKESSAYWALRLLREEGRLRRLKTTDEAFEYIPYVKQYYTIMKMIMSMEELSNDPEIQAWVDEMKENIKALAAEILMDHVDDYWTDQVDTNNSAINHTENRLKGEKKRKIKGKTKRQKKLKTNRKTNVQNLKNKLNNLRATAQKLRRFRAFTRVAGAGINIAGEVVDAEYLYQELMRDDADSWWGRHEQQYWDEFNYEENEEKELIAAYNRLSDAYYGHKYVNGTWQSKCECDGPEFEVETETVEETELNTPVACDPNEIVGLLGVGDSVTERFLKPGEEVAYTIYFENKSDAETAAQEIRVTETLDPALDWSTFRLGEVAFNNQIDNNLSGYQSGTSEVKMNGTDYYVRTEASCDPATGKVSWYLRIVDKTTFDEWPTDLHAGILPPNDDTFRGEGHVTYRVNVRNDATPGSLINASASIIFDYNAPIVTDPPWSNTVARLVAVSGKTGAGATIMVDPNWIKANIGESATDEQIADALNQIGKNGIKVWANAALGLDSENANDVFLVDVPQNDDSETVTVKSLKGELPERAWTPIKYRVDVAMDGSGAAIPGVAQDANEFGIDIGGDSDPTGIYTMLAVLTDDNGAEIESVPAANQIGILRKAAANKREIVPVPWTKFSDSASDIAVSNLVKTAGLSAGDKLYVYDDTAKLYATWELQSDKTWKPVKTVKMVNGKLEVQTADSPEVATVKRGGGVWLERQDTSKPVTLVGQHNAASPETQIDGGTGAAPKWNLIASPAITNWNLNAICEGVDAKDRIIVPTGKEPRIYTRDAGNAKWGYITYEANDKGIVRPVRKEDDTVIAPGTGFWYVSEGGAPVIKW